MNGPGEENNKVFRSAIWTTIIGVAVITFGVIMAALFAGLWIDRLMGSRHIFTFVLVLISIPVSILLTLWLVRRTTGRLKSSKANPSFKELDRGTDDNS